MEQFLSNIFSEASDFVRTLRGLINGSVDVEQSPGLLFIGAGVLAVLLIAFSLGRSRALLALVSLYASAYLFLVFPFFENLRGVADQRGLTVTDFALSVGILIVLYAITFFSLNFSELKGKLTLEEASAGAVFLIGLATAGFFASLIVGIAAGHPAVSIPSSIFTIFASDTARFAWGLIPLACILSARHWE